MSKIKKSFVDKIKANALWRTETFLVCAAVTLSILSSLMKSASENSKISFYKNKNKTTQIVIAGNDINKNSLLTKNNLNVKEYLISNVTSNMVPSSEVERILNQRINNESKIGDPILITNLQGMGQNSLANKIPVGRRFFSLQLKDKLISNGWVKPNDHVDILATLNLPDRGETTFTILQDITLVTVGKSSAWTNSKKTTGSEIGFFVTPDEFEILSFSQKKGLFSISLRNPQDAQYLETNGAFGKNGVDMKNFLNSKIIRKASGGGELNVKIGTKNKSI